MPNLFHFIILYQLSTICNSDTIQCLGKQLCKDEINICLHDEPCNITCDGQSNGQACQQGTINGSLATDVTLNCIHKQDCQDTKLICGTGICSIHCHGNIDGADNKDQCAATRIECGQAPCKIQLQCDGPNSCHGSTFPDDMISFECSGQCPPSYPQSFIQTTTNPTIYPTSNPSETPTTHVHLTMNPTNFPSKNPTQFPSEYHTITEMQTTSVSVTTTDVPSKYPTQNPFDGNVNPSITNGVEINESDEKIFTVHTILENTPLVVLFSSMVMVLICMGLICIFYFYKMKKKKRKQIADKRDDNEQKYNNIPMNASSEEQNAIQNVELQKNESLLEKRVSNGVIQSNEGCTAIQMGELDISEDDADSKLMNDDEFNADADEFNADAGSYENKKMTMDHVKTPSNSFSNGDKIDIQLNENEFVVKDSDSESEYDGKHRKITEGH